MINRNAITRFARLAINMGATRVQVDTPQSYEEVAITELRPAVTMLCDMLSTEQAYELTAIDPDNEICNHMRVKPPPQSESNGYDSAIISTLFDHIRALHTQLAVREETLTAGLCAENERLSALVAKGQELTLDRYQAVQALANEKQHREIEMEDARARQQLRQQMAVSAIALLQGPVMDSVKSYMANKSGLRALFAALSDDERKAIRAALSPETRARLGDLLRAEMSVEEPGSGASAKHLETN